MRSDATPPPKDPDADLEAEIRGFWERRATESIARDARLTMLTEHERYSAYVHEREVHYLSAVLESLGRPRVLDLGCGHGRLTFAIADRCSGVVGVDASQSLVQLAEERAGREGRSNLRFARRDVATPLPYSDGSFDVVLCSGLLNCLSDATCGAVLSWVPDVLRPGGILYLRNNAATRGRFERRAASGLNPGIIRTGQEYVELVTNRPELELLEERYLFAPLCGPNLLWYHVLPKALRDREPVRRTLDVWFSLESATSDVRLRLLGALYPGLLRFLHKPTAFRVLLARRHVSGRCQGSPSFRTGDADT